MSCVTKTTSPVQHSPAQADVQSRGHERSSLNAETRPTLNASPATFNQRSAAPGAAKAEPQETLAIQPRSVAFSGVQSEGSKLMVPAVPAERLLNVLAERGGSAFGSQQMFGRLLGVSTGTANATLHRLSELGRITVEAGRKGTLVTLATAH